MKKRTFVCFLIFTLCVFHSSLPGTVYGQDASLAEQVLEKYSDILQREDIQAILPDVLAGLKSPEIQKQLNPAIIAAAIANPDLLAVAGVEQRFIDLLKTDSDLQAMFNDAQVQALLQDTAAIDELATALNVAEPPVVAPPVEMPPVVEPPVVVDPPVVAPPVEMPTSLAQQVFEKYSTTLMRADIQAVLPDVLEGLKAPNTQGLLKTPGIIDQAIANPALLAAAGVEQPFIDLLAADAELKAMLSDMQVQELLQNPAAIDELAALLNVGEPPVVEPPVVEPPVVVDPPVVAPPEEMPPTSLAQQVLAAHSATLMRVDIQAVLPDVLTALQAPDIQEQLNPAIIGAAIANPDILAAVGVEQPFIDLLKTDAELQTMLSDMQVQALLQDTAAIAELERLLAAGPPVEPVEQPVEPPVVVPPVVEPPPIVPPVGQADPFAPITPANESIVGKSRLGGLDNNRLSGRQFVSEVFEAMGISLETLAAFGYTQDKVIDEILNLVPQGMIPKKQIKQVLASKHIKYFDDVIDGQDLGQQLDYENFGNAITPMLLELAYQNEPNRKYVTRDNLNVYARVPSANVGGVQFSLTDGRTVEGTQITSAAFGADTFPYTFRLEETLAATNLPAWPGLDSQLFSNVVLRYSQTGLTGDYIAVEMQPATGADGGVVWETEIGITAGSTYYYFEVMLAEPVTLEVLDREKIAAIVQHVLGGNTVSMAEVLHATKSYTIEGWAMPDPRNLQLADRGIINAIFTTDFKAALIGAMAGPISKATSGQQLTANDIVNALGKHQRKLQNILFRNANALTTQFENAFDPMLSSVFTLPRIDAATESIWAASIDSIADGNYYLGAVVLDANGNPLDQMQGEFTVDTSAPDAGIHITPGANATGYMNEEGVYVATAPAAGTTATLNITGTPKVADVAPGEGYLFYQEIKLDADGMPQSAWAPLTVDATMLASRIWDESLAQLDRQGAIPKQFSFIQGVPFEQVLALLSPGLIQQYANPFLKQYVNPTLKQVAPKIGDAQLSEEDSQTLLDILGATLDLINSIPITYGEPNNTVTMAIQGEQMPLLLGDYGVRAMGIDTLFNISAHTAPTHIRIVSPEYDTAAVTLAVIGDCNGDGDTDDPGESGAVGDLTIYANTTENIMLTVAIGNRTAHPASVMVQYMDASGAWQNINEVDLAGVAAGDTLEVSWNVADFDALVGAGSSVMVRAVAANALGLADPEPVSAQMMLDAGICPVVPEVVAITVTPAETNPDSGAPQGMLTVNATTPERTTSPVTAVRFEAKRAGDAAWTTIATVDSATGQEWSAAVDTTTLEDSITAASPAARDASKDDNLYTVRAIAIADGTDHPSAATATFSLDNVDDVAPLGPTAILLVEDSAGVIAPDGSGEYKLGGIVDDSVDAPVATFTLQPAAAPNTYTSVRLVQTDADGTVTEIDGEAGMLKITVDVGALENAAYTFHALAVDAAGNVQTDKSPTTTTNVANFRVTDVSDVAVTAVDGMSVENPESPVARDSFTVSLTVANSTVASGELSVTIDGNTATSETVEGPANTFSLTVDVSALPDGKYTPNAVVTQRNGAVSIELASITVAPQIAAITVDAAEKTNPDSGAPQGMLTINGYTSQRATSGTTAMRFQAKQSGDTEWKDIGTTDVSDSVAVEGQELVDIIEDLVGTVASGKEEVPVATTARKWTASIDTTELEDTITADSAAARDVSKDDNTYMVRAILSVNGTEIMSPAGVTATFSVDNVDDVAPLGPTAILLVEDTAGEIIPDEAGAYTVGGIVDDSVDAPVATFTIQPTAAADTYDSVRLVQTTADGTVTEIDGETGEMAITVAVSALENAQYGFHALAVDAAGNVQTDESPTTTVNVLNFRLADISDLAVTAVDGEAVAEPPAEPIPLTTSVTVGFTVANGSLSLEDVTGGTVNGSEMPIETAEEPENTFALTVDVSGLPDGLYTPSGVITQRNGSVSFSLSASDAMVNVDNTAPMVTLEAPLAGHTIDSLPTVLATYDDGAGAGVDGTSGSVALMRIRPSNAEDEVVDVDQAMLEKDAAQLVYTRNEQLPGGAYRIVVEVADILGNVGEASVEFAISGTIPTVAIQSPASGQTFEHGNPLISGEFSGAGELTVTTFTVDGVDATPVVDGNRFSYTPADALADGEHTVAVEVTDSNGKTAQTSVVFMVKVPKDTTPPVISEAAPAGLVKGDSWVTISAVVTDEQSDVVTVRFGINDKPLRSVPSAQIADGRINVADSFTPGTHKLKVVAISEGGTTEHSWTFTLVVDNVAPTITSITPSGTIRAGLPTISASANDESGVDEMSIVVMDSDGDEVEGSDADDGEDDVEGITRIDFIPENPLDEGTYTIEVRATDTIGNSATAKGTFTVDFDTAAPVITMSSPQQDARLTERRPTISITFTDAESGVDVDSLRFVLDDQLINLTSQQKSASQVVYVPLAELSFGMHTVKLEVSDMAHKEGNVSDKNGDARQANMAVHEFSFFVESEEGPVLAARPINAPNPFKENTRISFTLTRQSTVSIVIYDMTLRPVRVLVDNEVWDAGEYIGKNAIGWDGTTTGGEDLARGIYFCQIIVADGFEPEYVILKLALTR